MFEQIECAYAGRKSVFDNIYKDDLIIAFFPCIYFSALSQMSMSFTCTNYRKLSIKEATDKILERSYNRERFFRICVKMFSICKQRGLRLIMENPWSMQNFLKSNFVMPPTFIDNDRTLRGDFFKKPTAYWFVNCNPTNGRSIQKDKTVRRILEMKSSTQAGVCSTERSLISTDYARNFICDFIIGKEQKNTERNLFN